jgi:hypothetical protein
MERRKSSITKASPLPSDYISMVTEIFTTHFDAGLKILGESLTSPRFSATGEIFADEILVAVSLVSEGQLSATTVYASTDFDPKASAPTVQDLLGACVDAIGSIFGTLLDPKKPDQIALLAQESLSAMENIPFQWTSMESDQKQVFVKMDKANLEMDALTEEWLAKHDPEHLERQEKELKETEKLFFTGPKSKSPHQGGSGSGVAH